MQEIRRNGSPPQAGGALAESNGPGTDFPTSIVAPHMSLGLDFGVNVV